MVDSQVDISIRDMNAVRCSVKIAYIEINIEYVNWFQPQIISIFNS